MVREHHQGVRAWQAQAECRRTERHMVRFLVGDEGLCEAEKTESLSGRNFHPAHYDEDDLHAS